MLALEAGVLNRLLYACLKKWEGIEFKLCPKYCESFKSLCREDRFLGVRQRKKKEHMKSIKVKNIDSVEISQILNSA